jgi:DNA repair protein RAD7
MVGFMGANLRFLTLQMCGKITDTELKHLSDRCTQVQELDIDGPFLCSDDGLKSLFALPLKSLRIAHAEKMTGASLEELVVKCPDLEHLSLEYCGRLKDGAQVVSGLVNLKSLSLNHIGGMTNDTLKQIIESVGGNLKLLSLDGCKDMSDQVLAVIAKECPKLAELSLSDAPALTGEGFAEFFSTSKAHLKSISLHRNVTLPDSVIISLSNLHGPFLEAVNLNGLDELTGHALTTLAMNCPRLLELDVSWIRTVDDEFIEKLMAQSPGLKCVKVYGCNRLTEVTMKKALCNSAGHAILMHGNEFD